MSHTLKTIATPDPGEQSGYYMRYVLRSGHVPGVLSGAGLKGRAKTYGAWYAKQRDKAAAYANAAAQVFIAMHLSDNGRWCWVWVDSLGHPVKLILKA